MPLFYSAGPNTKVTPISCTLPLPNRIPGKNYSFSDHEALDAVLKIKHINKCKQLKAHTVGESKRAQRIKIRLECVKSVQEALKVRYQMFT